jgi:hypothetical protein
MEEFLNDSNILNVYQFGSFVYGSNHANSDRDYIIVAKKYFESKDINTHIFTIESFQSLLNECDIQMLECFFSPEEFILKKTHDFKFVLDKRKLRTSISTIASNSFVKGKKKLIVTGDYDLMAGIKSVYHSIRILSFGIQIAESGMIYNFHKDNHIFFELLKLSTQYERLELWNKIQERYKKVFNSHSSLFKSLAPKSVEDYNNKLKLNGILKKYGIDNSDLVAELMETFKLYN